LKVLLFAHRLKKHVSMGAAFGEFRSNRACIQHHLYHRLIGRKLHNLPAPNQISTAVSDFGYVGPSLFDQNRRDRRAHSAQSGFRLLLFPNGVIGRFYSRFKPAIRRQHGRQTRQFPRYLFHSQFACDLSGRSAAHTVRNHKQKTVDVAGQSERSDIGQYLPGSRITDGETVFVMLPNKTRIGKPDYSGSYETHRNNLRGRKSKVEAHLRNNCCRLRLTSENSFPLYLYLRTLTTYGIAILFKMRSIESA